MKLLPYILFEKYIYILALEIASPGNRHCANCNGTLSFPICNQQQQLPLLIFKPSTAPITRNRSRAVATLRHEEAIASLLYDR